MNSVSLHSEITVQPLPTVSFDDLVADNFENIFTIVNAFVCDHQMAILHTESVFRIMLTENISCRNHLYQLIGRVVRLLPKRSDLPNSMEFDDALCLLFKEVGGFRYRDISDLLGLSTSDVKHGIARSRANLMAA